MSTELATQQPQQLSPFDPTNLHEAMKLSATLAMSDLVPQALAGKPANVLLVMMKGRELGLSTMQSLGGISIVRGKPILEASLMVGLVLRHADICEYFTLTESTDAIATYRTKRRGAPEPVEMSFTIDEAKRAGLTGKDSWRNFAAAMLRARASAALARAVYPDLVAGIYVPGEIPGDGVPGSSPGDVARASDGGSVSHSTEASVSEHSSPAPAGPPSNPAAEPNGQPAAGDNPFATDAEFSPAEGDHVAKEAALVNAVFATGKRKGQAVESASLDDLRKMRDYLLGREKTTGNLLELEKLNFWISRKQPEPADYSPSEAPTQDQIDAAVFSLK